VWVTLSPRRWPSLPGFLTHNRSLCLASDLRAIEIADQRPSDNSSHRAIVLDGAGLESGVQICVDTNNHRDGIRHTRHGIS
jgi:hypothetical protein